MARATSVEAEASEPALRALGAAPSKQRSLTQDALRALLRNKAAVMGIVFLIVVTLLAIFAPVVAPHSPVEQNLLSTYARPSSEHWLGTDQFGRDMLSRIIYGARVSLSVAVITVIAVLIIGVPVGLITGYFGGKLDFLLMRLVDVMYAIPDLLFIILITTFLNAVLNQEPDGALVVLHRLNDISGGLMGVFIALAIFGWLTLSRLVRGQILSLRNNEYVQAARALGAGHTRIMLVHLLPNAVAPLTVGVALLVPSFILAEAGLSFLGLGIQPPDASWGIMVSEGVQSLRSHPHTMIVPGLALSLTLLSFNFIGDGLRDDLDPFMR